MREVVSLRSDTDKKINILKTITKEEAINKLEANFGSIYTKQDVLELLLQIEDRAEPGKLERMKMEIEVIEKFKDRLGTKISSELENIDSLIDYDSASFDMNYENKVELQSVEIESYRVEEEVCNGIDCMIGDLEQDLADYQKELLEELEDLQDEEGDLESTEVPQELKDKYSETEQS